MSETSLTQLDLNPELYAALLGLNLETLEAVRDTTTPYLQTVLSSEQVQEVLARLDFYFDRRFRSEVLCPMFPEPAYYVEIHYLGLSGELLLSLQEHYEYAYELAFQRKHTLKQMLSRSEIDEVEFTLYRFLEAYRLEEIVLKVEEENE